MLRLIGTFSAIILLAAACLDLQPPARIGVGLTTDGQVIAYYRSCKSTSQLVEVQLYQDPDTRGDFSDDIILWEVEARNVVANRFSVLVADEVPDTSGLAVRVPLAVDLTEDGLNLRIRFTTTSLPNGESLRFRYEELVVDSILTAEGTMTADEFAQPVDCG